MGISTTSYQSARVLVNEVTAEVAGDRAAQWRAELRNLVGRCALQLGRLDEALAATREAIRGIHDLHDDRLWPFLEGLRENLLTVLAALEPQEREIEDPLSHRVDAAADPSRAVADRSLPLRAEHRAPRAVAARAAGEQVPCRPAPRRPPNPRTRASGTCHACRDCSGSTGFTEASWRAPGC